MQQTLSANTAEVGASAASGSLTQLFLKGETAGFWGPGIPLGAHIVTPRRWYWHHGIYVGAGDVVHYQGLSSSLRRGPVTRVSLSDFSHGRTILMHSDGDSVFSGDEVVARACSRLGEDAYDVLRNNCEHFCFWCLMGIARSPQVERLFASARALELVATVVATAVNGWSTARHAVSLIT